MYLEDSDINEKWSIRSPVRILIVRFADVLSAQSTKPIAIIHFIVCTRGYEFEDKKNFMLFVILKKLEEACAVLL